MRRALPLLLLLAVAASLATADSSAVVGSVSLSLSESSPYAAVAGTTLYYSANSGTFTVTATDSSPPTIATVDFPNVFGDDPAVGTATSHVYSWTSSATDSGSKSVAVTDSDTSTGTASFTITPDTAPTVSNAAPTEVTGAGDQYWSASANTLWFRPAGSGSFTLNASASDNQSGVAQVAFPDVSGTSGWAGSNGGTDTSSPYATPTAYSWTAGAAAPGATTVTATNGTGMTATAAVTVSADSTAPSGQTLALGGGPWFTSASVPLTIGAGTDAGSGVDGTRGVVERASATLTNGSCGTFGTFSAVTLSGGANTTVTTGNCYRYQYKATDNVGNTSTASAASSDAKVDTTGPTTPTLFFTSLSHAGASGTTVYYGAKSGAFTLTAASSDAESGIASYAFPVIAGFTSIGGGGTRTYTFTGTTTAPSAPQTVTATNGAGQTSAPASFTLVADPTAPAVDVRCNGKPCVGSPYAKSVQVTVTASDGTGSGVGTIRYTVDGTDPNVENGTEYDGALTVRSLTRLKVRAYDKAGNASTTVSVTINSLVDKLVIATPARTTVKAGNRYLVVRMSTTRRSLAGAAMTRSGVKRATRWHFLLPSGTSIVRLRLPAGLKRPAAYKVVWTLVSGSQKATKTTFVSVR